MTNLYPDYPAFANFDVFDSFSDEHWRAESAELTDEDELT